MIRIGMSSVAMLVAMLSSAAAQPDVSANRRQQPPGTLPAGTPPPSTVPTMPTQPPAAYGFVLQKDSPQQREVLIRHLEEERERNPPKRIAPLPAQVVTPSIALPQPTP